MIVLKIVQGLNKGQTIPLKDGLTFGRLKGDVVLEDEDTDDPHAEIEYRFGKFFLKSLGVSGNILCDGEMVSHLVLKKGIQFQLGSVHFEAQEQNTEWEDSSKDSHQEQINNEEQSDNKDQLSDLSQVQFLSLNKEETQADSLEDGLWRVENDFKNLQFLKSPMYLKFEKGIQKGLCWELTYLPRRIGSLDADLPLIYHQFQNVCFELNLIKEKVIFSTEQSDLFLVNYKAEEEVELKHKDLIIIGASYIRVLMELS